MKINRRTLRSWLIASALSYCVLAQAQTPAGPPAAVSNSGPSDRSGPSGPWIDKTGAEAFIQSLPKSFAGAYEGGEVHAKPLPGDGGKIPTGGIASPLFGAKEFEQQLLLLEEFGTKKMEGATEHQQTLPLPASPTSFPDGAALDAFLNLDGFTHLPTKVSNTGNLNPWKPAVEAFLERTLKAPPAEGRPPGESWSHQRWEEFLPEVYFTTAQTGARPNSGFRDQKQRHLYQKGEFAPGGLYHTVYATDAQGVLLSGTTNGIKVQFHPNFPVQDPKSVWTFDGTFPGKLLEGRYGEPMLMRHYNALPIDTSANNGFGLNTITTHEHNGHNPAESDGFTGAFYFPGQYWDYRWPMVHPGYDTVNTTASDPRAAFPAEPGETLYVNDLNPGVRQEQDGRINLRGDWRETGSSHWFHDHMIDHTAENVYKGNAACFNMYSSIDRGNEAIDDGVNLRFPSGSALNWGNRDYDINLMIADKAWDADGQLFFNPFDRDGFLGDQILTNWTWKPYFNVRHRSYRLRFLNGAVARFFKFALVKKVVGDGGEYPGPPGSGESYDRIGFHMIANDGNILEHAIPFDGSIDLDANGNATEHKGLLPNMGVGERYDIIVDFASQGIVPGDKLYFVNVTEHADGRGPKDVVPLADILSGEYAAQQANGVWVANDPAVGKFLEFRVAEYTGEDLSMNPADFIPGAAKMVPLPIDRNDFAGATRRTFHFGRSSGTDSAPWTVKTDGGPALTADPRRISTAAQMGTGPTGAGFDGTNEQGYDDVGTREIWTLSTGGGWDHPVHVHFEEGVILSRDGNPPPVWEWWARKDLYRIGPSADSSREVEVALRIREFAGTFVEHCHTTTHEDHAMLTRWDSEYPGQVKLLPTPIPSWDGVEFVDSVALPTFRSGVNGPELPESDPFLTPVIDTFTGTSVGGKTTLSWKINQLSGDNLSSVELTPNIGSVLGRTSMEVKPSQSTIYRLTTKTSKGSSTATITVSPNGTVSDGEIRNGAAPGINLLTNHDFEAGLNDWTFLNTDAGSTTAAIDPGTQSHASVLDGSRIHRTIPVLAEKRYVFTAHYRNTGQPGLKMGIEFRDAAGTTLDEATSEPPVSETYRPESVRALAPVGAVSAVVYFQSEQPGTTHLDNTLFAEEVFAAPDQEVTYRIKFTGLFNSTQHPQTTFPANAQFAPLLAAAHARGEKVWSEGSLALPPVAELSENGIPDALAQFIDGEIGKGFGHYTVSSASVAGSGEVIMDLTASPSYPLVSLIGQLSPSPDWFTGLNGIELADAEGNWKTSIELDLFPLDAGVDSGSGYEAANLATVPRTPVTSLRGVAPFSSQPVGRVSISLLKAGPLVKGDNLLTNDEFEDGFNGWETYEAVGGSAKITSASANGAAAAELSGAIVHQSVAVEGGHNYKLAVQYFSSSAGGILAGVEFFDQAGHSIRIKEVTAGANTDFEAVELALMAPEDATTAKVYFWSAVGSTASVDGFEFREVDRLAKEPAAGGNKTLVNGDFASRLSSWDTRPLAGRKSVIAPSPASFKGEFACRLTGGMIYQGVAVSPGDSFALSGNYRSTSKRLDSEVGISFFDAAGTEIAASPYKFNVTRSYLPFAVSGVVPPRAVRATVYVIGSRYGALLIDELNLAMTPQKTSVPEGLLGPKVQLTTNAVNAEQPFSVRADFSQNVTGLTADDFAITNGTASGLSGISQSEYFLTVTPASAGGVRVTLPTGSASNSLGQGNQASNALLVGKIGEGEVEVDPDGEPAPVPESLSNRAVPEPTNLAEFIQNKEAAIVLGKALFWDMRVGSDNRTSCATCHYQAGADSRYRNQLNPGLLQTDASGEGTPDRNFDIGGPNHTLTKADFPFHKLADVNDRHSEVLSSVNDVVSSQGVFLSTAGGLKVYREAEKPVHAPDDLFHVGGLNTRRVEPRNAPSVINAIFNKRNFWDGRAQDSFNGVNSFGSRDADAMVWKADANKKVSQVKIHLDNASLASQAVAPALSNLEMSASGRTFPELGRKLLGRRPLDLQFVHPDDSVLGQFSRAPLRKGVTKLTAAQTAAEAGLTVEKYSTLIEMAFRPEWWQGTGRINVDMGDPSNGTADSTGNVVLSEALSTPKRGQLLNGFSHMEANFSLFFGLAIQLYEATLVSDETPFDKYMEGDTKALTAEQQRGMALFFGKAKCANCHDGPEFTKASVHHVSAERIERMAMADGQNAVYDNGFYNIGVRPSLEDLGIGSKDPFGYPLSESGLAEQFGSEIFRELVGQDPEFSVVPGERIAANGAFKTPGLRNVELTAPYFHNGGQRTLLEVVEFYNRGGDFHETNIADLDPEIESLGLTDQEKLALVAFMKSLTDERVRHRRAPFDHPSLLIPVGHKGNTSQVSEATAGRARDMMLKLPMTGAEGGNPLPNFLE